MSTFRIIEGDAMSILPTLEAESVQTVVTSPPYWGLRDYGTEGQLGLEPTPELYVENLVAVFREVRRVLRDDGTVWLNLGDSYATGAGKAVSPGGGAQGERFQDIGPSGHRGSRGGSPKHAMPQVPDEKNPNAGIPTFQPNRMPIPGLKPKDLVGAPWRVAFALQADGWWLRSDIVWAKPNPMPESVTDRPTKAHEYLFLLTKSARYYYDQEAVREPHALETQRRAQYEWNEPERGNGRTVPGTDKRWNVKERTVNLAAGRNLRTVWTIPTEPFPEAHFATFPKKLVEPCVKAGSSEKGNCSECGAPWERVVEREGSAPRRVGKSAAKVEQGLVTAFSGYEDGSKAPTFRTTGWRPTCGHDAEPIPAVVLDPFCGSGTTGVVTLREGRSFVGVELNPEYAEMTRRRIQDDAPLLNVEAT